MISTAEQELSETNEVLRKLADALTLELARTVVERDEWRRTALAAMEECRFAHRGWRELLDACKGQIPAGCTRTGDVNAESLNRKTLR